MRAPAATHRVLHQLNGYDVKTAFLHILGSSALAQILLLASTPFLMREYDVQEFGVFGLYSVIAMVVSILVSLKIDHSLHLTDTPQHVFSASLAMAMFATIFGLLFLFITSYWLSVSNVVLALIFGGSHAIVTTCTLMGNLRKRFRLVAVINLLVPCVFIGLAFTITEMFVGQNALLLSQALAHVVAATTAFFCLRSEFTIMSVKAIYRVLLVHWQDIVYLVPSRFISILSSNSAVIGSVLLFGAEFAGFVVVANRISRAPVRVIGNGLSNTLRAAVGSDAILLRTFYSVAKISAFVGLICVFTVWLIPVASLEYFVGDEWDGLKSVMLISTIAAGFQLMGVSVDSVLTVYLKRRYFLLSLELTLSALLAYCVALIAGFSFINYLIVNAACMSLVYLRFFYVGWRHVSLLRFQNAQ